MVCTSLTTGVLGAGGVSNHIKTLIILFPSFPAQMYKAFAKSIADILEENDRKTRGIATGNSSDNWELKL